MVKWTNKLARMAQITKSLVKGYKVIPKCLFSWIFFIVPTIINTSTQTYIVKIIALKSSLKLKSKNISKFGFGHKLYDPECFELEFFFVLLIHNEFEKNIKKIAKKINVMYF
jgi:hypothetical protein